MTCSYDPLTVRLIQLFTNIFAVIAEALVWMWISRFRCERLKSSPEVISSVGNGFELAVECRIRLSAAALGAKHLLRRKTRKWTTATQAFSSAPCCGRTLGVLEYEKPNSKGK